MKISRKQFLASAFASATATCGAASYIRFLEPDWFEITTKDVALTRLKQPVKLLHLSDLHASDAVPYALIERAIDLAIEQDADLCCITGDFITAKLSQSEEYIRILRKLSDRLPCYACIGNHDGGSWAGRTYGYPDISTVQNLLVQSIIRLLFNTNESIIHHGQSIELIGLGDLWSKDLHPERVMKDKGQSDIPVLLLSHNPDSKASLKSYDWDLMLCGHTHGGQLVIPFLDTRPFLPIRDKRFAEGLHRWKGRQIHVTRGIGNLHGMRINCRPEVSILNLRPVDTV